MTSEHVPAPAQTVSNPVRPAPTGLVRRACACGGAAGLDGTCPECRADRLRRSSQGADKTAPHSNAERHDFAQLQIRRESKDGGPDAGKGGDAGAVAVRDAGPPDAGTPDAGTRDAGPIATPDAGAVRLDAGVPPVLPVVGPPVAITWKTNVATDATDDDSVTGSRRFTVAYTAVSDPGAGLWRLRVTSIDGGVDIAVHTDAWKNADAAPPATEADARAAVTEMKAYYARGSAPVGAWHTEAASRAHEGHHDSEWRCSAEHYWPATQTAIEKLTAPLATYASAAAAVAGLRAGATGADAKIAAFYDVAHRYWFTLSDAASSRPYAAGQLALNTTIANVQTLAAAKGWTVPAGVATPSAATPCYQPWLAYAP